MGCESEQSLKEQVRSARLGPISLSIFMPSEQAGGKLPSWDHRWHSHLPGAGLRRCAQLRRVFAQVPAQPSAWLESVLINLLKFVGHTICG